jgi:hypothetical protein
MTIQNRRNEMTSETQDNRRTVIQTPRTDSLFSGWGVKF